VSTGRDLIYSLPELPLAPLELGGKLALSRRGPFLTIDPPARPAPAPPKGVAHLAPTSAFEIRKYWTQCTYPRLICIDPGDLIGDLVLDPTPDDGTGGVDPGGVVGPRPDLAVLARRERHYKLSKWNGSTLHHPYWCTVKYGPWLAVAVETESCITGAPNRWEFAIVEMPNVAMIWYGAWLDQPSLPNLTVIKGDLQMFDVTRSCCAGYKYCPTTESCIPLQVNCQSPVPV
jgi:hypothetical protein